MLCLALSLARLATELHEAAGSGVESPVSGMSIDRQRLKALGHGYCRRGRLSDWDSQLGMSMRACESSSRRGV